MFNKFIFYSRIFFLQHSFGAGKDLSLRGNFFTTLIGSLCFFYLHLISFQLVINNFAFSGWTQDQLWVLLFTFQIFTYLAFYVFWRGLISLPREINIGAFDILLTKPVNLRFISFFRNGSLHNLLSALLAVGYLVSTIAKHQLPIAPVGIFLYITSICLSLWIFHCLSLIFISINFRYGYLPATSAAPFEVQEIFKYPADIFSHSSLWQKLAIYPLVLLTTIPTVAILLKPVSPNLIIAYLLSFIILSYLADRIWKSTLRHYSSASS